MGRIQEFLVFRMCLRIYFAFHLRALIEFGAVISTQTSSCNANTSPKIQISFSSLII